MTVLLSLPNEKPTCSMVRYMCSAGREKLYSMRKRQGVNFLFLGETVRKSQNNEIYVAKFLSISQQKIIVALKQVKLISFFSKLKSLKYEICLP